MPHFALAFIILTIHNMVDITSFHLREDVEFFMNYIGVIGAGRCDIATGQLAREVGREIALSGSVLVCGGLGGVMKEACRGCREAGGIALGILPGLDRNDANPYVSFAFATGMGEMRNFLVVRCSDILIAIAGEYGTLSEIAIALKVGKRVIALRPYYEIDGIEIAPSPQDAVQMAVRSLKNGTIPKA